MSKIKPYKWQKKAFERFKDATSFMLKVCCGGGKTFAASMIALYKAMPVIVIAPNTICEQWKEELIEHNDVDEKNIWVYSVPEHTKGKEEYENAFMAWLEK